MISKTKEGRCDNKKKPHPHKLIAQYSMKQLNSQSPSLNSARKLKRTSGNKVPDMSHQLKSLKTIEEAWSTLKMKIKISITTKHSSNNALSYLPVPCQSPYSISTSNNSFIQFKSFQHKTLLRGNKAFYHKRVQSDISNGMIIGLEGTRSTEKLLTNALNLHKNLNEGYSDKSLYLSPTKNNDVFTRRNVCEKKNTHIKFSTQRNTERSSSKLKNNMKPLSIKLKCESNNKAFNTSFKKHIKNYLILSSPNNRRHKNNQ